MTSYDRFAKYYDDFYEPIVDYDGDVTFLQECFRRFSRVPVKRILDLGCGTGAHASRLAAAGYDITGVDLSAEQLAIARQKVPGAHLFEMDFTRALPDGAQPDAVVSLFAAWCYALSDDDAGRALDLVRSRLPPGALFVFEFWNPRGLKPSQNWGEVELPDGRRLVRMTKPWVEGDVYRFRMEHFVMRGDLLDDHFTEVHALRLRTPEQTDALVRAHGFEVAAMTKGARDGKSLDPPDVDEFRVMCVARRL